MTKRENTCVIGCTERQREGKKKMYIGELIRCENTKHRAPAKPIDSNDLAVEHLLQNRKQVATFSWLLPATRKTVSNLRAVPFKGLFGLPQLRSQLVDKHLSSSKVRTYCDVPVLEQHSWKSRDVAVLLPHKEASPAAMKVWISLKSDLYTPFQEGKLTLTSQKVECLLNIHSNLDLGTEKSSDITQHLHWKKWKTIYYAMIDFSNRHHWEILYKEFV